MTDVKRLRIVSFQVQPLIMLDDGDRLEPLPVQPVNISAADWPRVQEILTEAIARLCEQVGAS